ncbi:putative cruciform cutting endonuclease [Triangularia setosa]|uniref:Cruciform cutting endonuclease n=1 Tax=Triangularia setosa TaxID=2587417 RepID=A0AAN7ABE0_9PEZI|nr:putative cruciform cutting endonuclease [Podospora setosa]
MPITKTSLPGKITVARLQALCSSTGLTQAGSKSTIQQNLRQAAQSVQHIPDNARILSIDLGLKNFAFSLVTPASSPSAKTPLPTPSDSATIPQALLPPVNLQHWNHLDLTTPLFTLLPQDDPSPPSESIQFNPSSLSSLTYSLISTYLLPLKPTHILIERQRFRTGNASNIFEWTIRVNTLEAMLHACFATLKGVNMFHGTVISISPKSVAGYLFPNPGKAAPTSKTNTGRGKSLNSYQILKANKVSMLGEWLQQGKLIKPKDQAAEMARGFLSAWAAKGIRRRKNEVEGVLGPGVKLDDLSDSVLQGMVWLQWQRNLEGLKGVDLAGEEDKGSEKVIKKVKRGTGRIKDVDVKDKEEGEIEVGPVMGTPEKGRGRPKKAEVVEKGLGEESKILKKRPGRPKKTPAQEEGGEAAAAEADAKKKGRGRSRKVPVSGNDEVDVEEAETGPPRREPSRIETDEDDDAVLI